MADRTAWARRRSRWGEYHAINRRAAMEGARWHVLQRNYATAYLRLREVNESRAARFYVRYTWILRPMLKGRAA